MNRYHPGPLTAVFCVSLAIALGVPAVVVFLASGLAITALVSCAPARESA